MEYTKQQIEKVHEVFWEEKNELTRRVMAQGSLDEKYHRRIFNTLDLLDEDKRLLCLSFYEIIYQTLKGLEGKTVTKVDFYDSLSWDSKLQKEGISDFYFQVESRPDKWENAKALLRDFLE